MFLIVGFRSGMKTNETKGSLYAESEAQYPEIYPLNTNLRIEIIVKIQPDFLGVTLTCFFMTEVQE